MDYKNEIQLYAFYRDPFKYIYIENKRMKEGTPKKQQQKFNMAIITLGKKECKKY